VLQPFCCRNDHTHHINHHGRVRVGGPDTSYRCPLPPLCHADLEEFHDTECRITELDEFGLGDFHEAFYTLGVRKPIDIITLDAADVRAALTPSGSWFGSLFAAPDATALRKFNDDLLPALKHRHQAHLKDISTKEQLLEALLAKRQKLVRPGSVEGWFYNIAWLRLYLAVW